jgi:hypothetical protein
VNNNGIDKRQKVQQAKVRGIDLPEKIPNNKIVAVYGLFAKKKNEEFCIYVGKATNLRARMLGSSSGHIHLYLNNNVEKLVPKLIDQHIQAGYRVEIRILQEVDYQDSSFSRAAHRLAFAELKWIVGMQKEGLCLDQLPEGAGPNSRAYWERHYKN